LFGEVGAADLFEDVEMGSGGPSESSISDAVEKEGSANPERTELARSLGDIFQDSEVFCRKVVQSWCVDDSKTGALDLSCIVATLGCI
jgi:hypothetical protein